MAGSSKQLFLAALKARYQGKKKLPKLRRVRASFPWAIEKQYGDMLAEIWKPLHEKVIEYMRQQAEVILKGDSTQHSDTIPGKGLQLLMNTMQGWVAQYFPTPLDHAPLNVTIGLGKISDSVKSFVGKQFGKQTKSLLGFEFQGNDIYWQTLKPQWEEQNYNLIKSVAQEYISKINNLTEKAVTSGASYQELIDNIEQLGPGIYKEGDTKKAEWLQNKARLLARDQIGKLNGYITQSEQVEVGVDMYTWDTAGDERVRPSHRALEGLLCRWDDPTVYSDDGGKTWVGRSGDMFIGHPGEDIQCRCVGIPYFAELLYEAAQKPVWEKEEE